MREMKKRKWNQGFLLMAIVMLFGALLSSTMIKAETIKMNKRQIVLEEGKTSRLKVYGTVKQVSWVSQNDLVAEVDTNGLVTAKASGSTVIEAKVNKKSYQCKVTVTPSFLVDEDSIAEEMVGRKISFAGQDIIIHDEEEISEVKIISQISSKDGKKRTVKAQISLERSVATFSSEVYLYYKNVSSSWKITSVKSTTEIEELNLEGVWEGEADIYNYKRNSSENCKVTVEIDTVKNDGKFTCEATIEGLETDVLSMYGELDEETGEVTFYGVNWISAESDNAKSLQEKGKVLNFYCILDFANDTYISNDSVALKKTYVENLVFEKQGSDTEEQDDTGYDGTEEQEEGMIYE